MLGPGYVCVWLQVPSEAREGVRSYRAGVTGDCELCDMGAGTLKEQYILFISDPSFQHLVDIFIIRTIPETVCDQNMSFITITN